MIDFGTVRPGTTLRIPFQSTDGSGASVTLTGLLSSDIEVYKDGSTTQRASDSGYALLDTDGIDFDGITGIHGFSIDLADNTTAGFYAAGSQYFVVVSSVTVDGQTVSFIAARFEIGYPDAVLNTTIATLSSQTSFTLTAGPAEDDALNGCQIVIHDVASAVQVGRAVVLDYTGSTKTVTLAAATTFTAAATDNVAVLGLAPLQPTVPGRTLDVSTGGEAGVDWANVGSPTTTLNLSGTTVATVTTLTGHTPQTGDSFARIGATGSGLTSLAPSSTALSTAQWSNTRAGYLDNLSGGAVALAAGVNVTQISGDSTAADNLEAALDGTGGVTITAALTGNITGNLSGSVGSVTATVSANVVQISGDTVAADNAESFFDGTGYAGTNNVIPTVTTLTNLPAITSNWLTAAGLAADAGAEIAAAVFDLATSGHTTSGTFGAAVVAAGSAGDPWSTALPGAYGAGTAGAILATTIPSTLSTLSTASAVSTLAGYVDTEVAAIKAKTDNLPASPAATGDIPTVAQIWTTALTEAYRSAGGTGTGAQLLYEILQNLTEFVISGTTKTVRRLDGSTTAKTYTLNAAISPTGITETT